MTPRMASMRNEGVDISVPRGLEDGYPKPTSLFHPSFAVPVLSLLYPHTHSLWFFPFLILYSVYVYGIFDLYPSTS
jgi:hypothetical protein